MLVDQPQQESGEAAPPNADAADLPAENLFLGDDNPGEDRDDVDPPEEEDELEVDGRKFALPKAAVEKIKAERMMHADYTRKTQEVAASRTQLETQQQQFEQQRKSHQQHIQELAKVVAIDDQLAQYQKLDWARLAQEQPEQAILFQQQQRALEAERNNAVQTITQQQQQSALEEQQRLAKLAQDADAYVRREIPNWTPERDNQLLKFGQELGLSHQELMPVFLKHPQLFKVLHQAELYTRLQEAQAKKKSASASAPPVEAKPVPRAGASAKVEKDPTKMSDAEFAAYRRKVSTRR